MKDHTLLAIAQVNPANVAIMANIEGVETLDVRHKGNAMLSVLKRVNEEKNPEWPEPIVRLDEYPGYKQNFKKVKSYLGKISEQANLLTENLASKKQINQFLSWHFKLNDAEHNIHLVDVYAWLAQASMR